MLLAACTPAPPAGPVEPDTPVASFAPAPAPAPDARNAELFGEWQVAALDTPLLPERDRTVGDPTRVAMLIGVSSIDAASQCVPFFFRYRRTAERLEVEPERFAGPVCARGLLPYEAIFGRVLAGIDRIELVPAGLRLAGSAGSVTLRRPETGHVGNPFGNQPAPGPELFWGHFRLIEAGGVPARGSVELAVGRTAIEARSGCVSWRWRRDPMEPELRYAPDPAAVAVCERGLTETERAMERIIPQIRSIDWVAPYRARLSGPAGAILLERVRERR